MTANASNTSTPASQNNQGNQPAPKSAAAAGKPAALPAPAVPGPFGVASVSLADLGYPDSGSPAASAPQAEGENPNKGGEPDSEAGKPGADDGKPKAGTELVAENGRKFTTLEDAVKTYNESSKEAQRLNDAVKTAKFTINDVSEKLDSANKTILAMQEYIGAGVYPNSKTAEELTAMDEEAKQEYYADKRDWKKRVEGFKKQMENAKTGAEQAAQAVKDGQERTRLGMKNSPDEFPGFSDLEPSIGKILTDVPSLAQQPNAFYLAYFIALGDSYLSYLRNVKANAGASRTKAAEEAGASAAATGGGTPSAAGGVCGGAKKSQHDEMMERTADAYHKRTKVF